MPNPRDTLENTYWLVDEDVDDNLGDILKRLDFELPPSRTLEEWAKQIETLEDVARWVQWVSSKQESRANR